jgi:hypothetical protein
MMAAAQILTLGGRAVTDCKTGVWFTAYYGGTFFCWVASLYLYFIYNIIMHFCI